MATGLRATFEVINRMVTDGVIRQYAVTGAVAALNYMEPTLTEDLDVLVTFDNELPSGASALLSLQPILAYLKSAGYREFDKEGVVIEGWPVQFLPVASALDAEGLADAVEMVVEASGGLPAVTVRMLRAEHLVATALKIGRPKDRVRIVQFLEEGAIDHAALRGVLQRHGLMPNWTAFCRQAGIPDPLK